MCLCVMCVCACLAGRLLVLTSSQSTQEFCKHGSRLNPEEEEDDERARRIPALPTESEGSGSSAKRIGR